MAAPVVRQFQPELILVSAGFDAHARDPLAGMRVSTEQFGRLTGLVTALADEVCSGRVVALTEGGYDLQALAASLTIAISILAGDTSLAKLPEPTGPTPRGEATLAAVRPQLKPYWKI